MKYCEVPQNVDSILNHTYQFHVALHILRHSHIISAAGLTRPELISVLVLARKQWPSAKFLGISELGLKVRDGRIVSCGRLCPSDVMNSIRRELSDLP